MFTLLENSFSNNIRGNLPIASMSYCYMNSIKYGEKGKKKLLIHLLEKRANKYKNIKESSAITIRWRREEYKKINDVF